MSMMGWWVQQQEPQLRAVLGPAGWRRLVTLEARAYRVFCRWWDRVHDHPDPWPEIGRHFDRLAARCIEMIVRACPPPKEED